MRGMRLFREARRLVDYGERYYCKKLERKEINVENWLLNI